MKVVNRMAGKRLKVPVALYLSGVQVATTLARHYFPNASPDLRLTREGVESTVYTELEHNGLSFLDGGWTDDFMQAEVTAHYTWAFQEVARLFPELHDDEFDQAAANFALVLERAS